MDSSKKPWESKTMIINGVLGLLTAVALFVPAAAGAKDFINAHGSEIALCWSMLNVVLRAVTKDKIVLVD